MFELHKTTLQLLKNKDLYDKLRGHVNTSLVDVEVRRALSTLDTYWKNYPAHEIVVPDVFLTELGAKYADLDKEQYQLYQGMVNIMMQQPDKASADGVVRSLQTLAFADKLEKAYEDYHEGRDIDLYETITDITARFEQDISRNETIDYCRASIFDIIEEEEHGVVLPWFLPSLAGAMPNIRTGMQIIFAARPGKGKTSFCASQAVHLASQTPDGRPIAWFNNEGKKRVIKGTTYRAALNKSFADIIQMGAEKVRDAYIEVVGDEDRIRIFDVHGRDYRYIERIIKDHQPAVCIWDMLDNIGGFGDASRTDERLESLYKWAREQAVIQDFLSIPTSQISTEGEGKAWCTQEMLKDSKCLGKGTPVRMYSGDVKSVEDITVGDEVMGIDSTPRKVLATGSGHQEMYRVSGHGWEFTCNKDHILTTIKSTTKHMNGHKQYEVVDLPLRYFLNNPSRLAHYKALPVRAYHWEKHLPMDPYIFGLWLGDGSSKEVKITTADTPIKEFLEGHKHYQHTYSQPVPAGRKPLWDVYHTGGRALLRELGVYQNKHIPQVYKTASLVQREALLAGLMDSDGTVDSGSCSITLARKGLVEDIHEVAMSLGYRSKVRKSKPNAWTVQFANTDMLPVLLQRKACVCVQRYSTMTIDPLGHGEYYGITVNGDSRYSLGFYIATHNTGKQGACEAIVTMGAVNNPKFVDSRYIYVPKTKFVPEKGHRADCYREVHFDGPTCTFSEISPVEKTGPNV